MARRNKHEEEPHYCHECAHCVPVYDHHTLTVNGKKPTLGRCPYWKESRSVILSQRSCRNFKKKI